MGLFKRINYKQYSDEALIDLFKNQDDLAFGEIYLRYGHLVVGLCMKYLKNKMQAEDIAMQIFEKIHLKIQTHSITHFKSWFYMVAKNECLMYLRKDKSLNEIAINELSLNDDASIQLEETELKILLLEEHLSLLKEDQRICLEQFYLKEESYQQISSNLNLTVMQVKSAIQNGKRNLKIKLEQFPVFTETK
jgi:RNA polymerase sigma-70 factor (ECF subfamily)